MKRLILIMLAVPLIVLATQRIVKLLPLDGDFDSQGSDYISLAESNSWSGYFMLPGFKHQQMPFSTDVDIWILGDSTAAGDNDSLSIILQPLFYDATDDTARISTTTALAAANASTDQAQLATVALDSIVVTPADYDYSISGGTLDFMIHRSASVGKCDGVLMTITLGSGAGTIRFKPRVYATEHVY